MGTSTLSRRLGNLPVDVTTFVGRRRELADVKRLVPASRLVTLTGVGGVGKTRLALRVAAELQRGFSDGVWLVELAGLQEEGLVSPTVAAALGVHDRGADRPLGALLDFLETRQLLLVLDNCEHMLQACAVLADALLRACAGLRILATSRQSLGIAGEQIVAVPPLSVPGPDRPPSPEGLAQYGAVSLLVERAAAVRAGFAINAGNQAAVARIVRRLDGIPLAIELAAGRLRALSLEELAERLDDRYGLLTGGSRAALPRQQTLRALIDWSFVLCSVSEQLMWERASVFGGAFDLLAAEEVCSGGEIPAEAVLDLVTGLVDKSIVVPEDRDGRVRYQLSETLRAYGRDRLAEVGATPVRRRHRDWCRGLVAQAEAGWFSADQVELFSRLRREHANLRAALNFCVTEPGESEVGLAMASDLRFYWLMSGLLSEGRHWLERLLGRELRPGAVRVKGLCVDGHLAVVLNDFLAAKLRLGEARALAQRLGDVSGATYVTQISGLSALYQGDTAGAALLFERALADHRDLGDQAATAYDLLMLAHAKDLLGDDERALGLFEESLAMCESRGESWLRALALFSLGIEACRRADYQRATAVERHSIRLRLPLEDRRNIGNNIEVLAWCAVADMDSERAARLFGAARSIQQAAGTSLTPPHLSGLHDQYETAARRTLGEKAFDRAFQRGLRLGFDEAVVYAQGDTSGPASQPRVLQPAAVSVTLTGREREIAELITRGLSNKEIAGALVISQRTAEGHVEHILTKLGFTSRSQVAAWVAEHRVTLDPG
jgi:predicted ATPase/DNA-binding CsgD family transcriptional regulator